MSLGQIDYDVVGTSGKDRLGWLVVGNTIRVLDSLGVLICPWRWLRVGGSVKMIPDQTSQAIVCMEVSRVLGAAHVGYTLGVCWVADKLIPGKRRLDYRGIAAAALAPDIVDRLLYVFAMPRASSGRLIAHTALFQVGAGVVACALWPKSLAYALASGFHLALDTPGIPKRWLRHVFYPLGGFALRHLNIEDDAGDRGSSYIGWVRSRLKKGSEPYRHASKSALTLELGGAAIIVGFVFSAYLRRQPGGQEQP